MYNSRTIGLWMLLLSIVVGTPIACSRHPSSDDKIAKDIQEKVAADPDTRDSQVSVAAKDGKVTLTGNVKTPVAQKKIEEIAHAETGNPVVEDHTTISPEAMAPQQQPTPIIAAAPAPAPAPVQVPVEKPKPEPIVVPSGTVLTVRTSQDLSSKTSQTGQIFLATLAQPISVQGRPALPQGATVNGKVVNAKAKGKLKGQGELTLALTSISLRDHVYPIETHVQIASVSGKGKRTAATTGGGAAGGALIGGLTGGGKGAGIGALVGAGAGLVGGALTGNKQIEIPAESALRFTLSSPLTLPPPGE
jgi:hypothetical protein